MIVPMKKVHLVVLDRERESALTELRKLGVIHVVSGSPESPTLDGLAEKKSRAEGAMGYIRELKVPAQTGPAGGDIQTTIDTVLSLAEERKTLEDGISRDTRELERLAPWGAVDPAALAELAAQGIALVPYEVDEKRFAQVPEDAKIIMVGRDKKAVRFLVLREEEAADTSFPTEIQPLQLPDVSTATMAGRVEGARKRIEEINEALLTLAAQKGALKDYLAVLDSEREFEEARAGMQYLYQEDEKNALVLLEGFVPEKSAADVLSAAKGQGWAAMLDDPALDDEVPTLVSNSPIVRMIQPVFDFLGTIPNYREYDVSAWFLLFFSFFFAMIFGDAGYGSILLIAGIIGAVKSKKAGKRVPDIIRLLLELSVFTIIWGVVTLNYFGLDPSLVPGFLKSLSIYWISNANPASGENVKVLCFYLGTFQLSIAHLKNIKRDFGSLKWLGQLGQLMMVIGMISVVFNLVLSSTKYPIPTYSLYLLAIGFVFNFVFANYEGSIIKSILASFANFISVFLGVVNVFADIVSYIRLWAVGLAGLAIAQTVNNMLGPMLGKFSMFVFGVLALAFAHSFNIILCFLSVIVHGVRLNMLEFSVHLGMEWSGFAYCPFRERLETTDTTSKEQL